MENWGFQLHPCSRRLRPECRPWNHCSELTAVLPHFTRTALQPHSSQSFTVLLLRGRRHTLGVSAPCRGQIDEMSMWRLHGNNEPLRTRRRPRRPVHTRCAARRTLRLLTCRKRNTRNAWVWHCGPWDQPSSVETQPCPSLLSSQKYPLWTQPDSFPLLPHKENTWPSPIDIHCGPSPTHLNSRCILRGILGRVGDAAIIAHLVPERNT